ncbi:MAG: radical SAM protein [Acidobacteria bacterium]|nr:radical SAM protein [Acidobacteriota bacterium]
MRKRLSFGLIELPATVDGRLGGKLAKDVYSLFRFPARGIPQLTGILQRDGYTNLAIVNPKYNNNRGRFSPAEFRQLAACDVVGISAITRTAPQSYELATELKRVSPQIKIIFGGPHTTTLPEEALQYGDIVVLHEGDVTIKEVMERLEDQFVAPLLDDVPGLVFKRPDGEIVYTAERPFLTSEELSSLPHPVLAPEELRGISHNVLTTSRGCPFKCEFCDVIVNFGAQFRFMDDDSTIELIKYITQLKRTPIFFGDDIFTANRKRTQRILERILSEGIPMPNWAHQDRVESARDPELLKLKKRANCGYVMIGLESINPQTLKLYNKHATLEKNILAIEAYHHAGIKVHGMFVLGSDADTKETIRETLEWAKKMKLDTAQFFALTAVPGPPLTQRLEREGRVLSNQWHLFDAQHAVVRPARMTPCELQDGIFQASLDFYSYREAFKHLFSGDQRLYNSFIRIRGRYLSKQIIKDNREYQAALQQLDHWYVTVQNGLQGWRERLDSLVNDVSASVEEQRAHLEHHMNETVHRVKDSYTTISEQFRPYCKQVVDDVLTKIHECYHQTVTPSASTDMADAQPDTA